MKFRVGQVFLALTALLLSSAHASERTTALVAGYNASGQALFQSFAAEPGNIVISPYSIGSAMSAALSGARGDTEAEMLRVLQQHLTRADIDASYAELRPELDRYNAPASTANDERPVKLNIANALMVREGVSVLPAYSETLKTSYGAELFPALSAAKVNGWVSQKTNGEIPQAIDKINPNTIAVLINAIYFEGRWATAFDPSQTGDEDFHVSPDKTIKAPMMRQTGPRRLVKGQDYTAINLDYGDGKLGMVVALPNEGAAIDAIAARLTGAELTQLFTSLNQAASAPVDLRLPRFKARLNMASLKGRFEGLGMRLPFDLDKADFSGIIDKRNGLYIEDVIHNVVFEVTERGAKGAASTGIRIDGRSISGEDDLRPKRFHVDRPFLFYVVDLPTGAILFQGRIVDPTSH